MLTFTTQKTVSSQKRQVYTGDKSVYQTLSSGGDLALNTANVSYWKLEEITGTRIDSVGVNDLVDNNAVGFGAGVIGNGANFALVGGNYLSITDALQVGLDFTSDFTSSLWVKFNTLPVGAFGAMCFYQKGFTGNTDRAYDFLLQNLAGVPNLFVQTSDTGSGGVGSSFPWTPSVGVMYNLVVVYTASTGTIDFYVDGVFLGTGVPNVATSIFDGVGAFTIGDVEGGSNIPVDGIIDEVSFWARTLTAGEILTNNNSGQALQPPFIIPTIFTCYLRPLNEEQSASNGVQFGLGFQIIVECEVDIREGDMVTIDSVEYTLRGVANHDRGGITRYKKALALKGEKQ